jgi:molybdopterin/thiamine biosynthesis adenylyltransferase
MSATDELRPWWERHPERLQWEVANFADRGLVVDYVIGGNGPVVDTKLKLSDGREIPVRLSFPFEYPFKPPSANVESGLLGPPHEVAGGLCLFDDAANQWNPQRSAAELVDVRVRPLIEAILVQGDLSSSAEEQIPDQVGKLYMPSKSGVVFVPDPYWAPLPDVRSGPLVLTGDGSHRLVAYAEEFGLSEPRLRKRLDCDDGIAIGRWAEFASPPSGYQTPENLLSNAHAALPGLFEPVSFADSPRNPEWIALNYEEEGPSVGQWRRQWVVFELSDENAPPVGAEIWEVQALSLAERQLRTPELVGLDTAKIVLLGVGSLGSKVAVELAKASCGTLVLFDSDSYDVNNAVRHELPTTSAGARKAEAVGSAIEAINPFGQIEVKTITVGYNQLSANEFLAALEGAVLVIETTGSRAVTRIAQRYCRIAGVPLLAGSLTRGARGGDMVLLGPEDCFDCFLLAQQQGIVPMPAATLEAPPVMPVGCGDAAFSGAGFDASELSSSIARMAIRATGITTYPALDHNWAVLNFASEPHFEQGTIKPDPGCGHRG